MAIVWICALKYGTDKGISLFNIILRRPKSPGLDVDGLSILHLSIRKKNYEYCCLAALGLVSISAIKELAICRVSILESKCYQQVLLFHKNLKRLVGINVSGPDMSQNLDRQRSRVSFFKNILGRFLSILTILIHSNT